MRFPDYSSEIGEFVSAALLEKFKIIQAAQSGNTRVNPDSRAILPARILLGLSMILLAGNRHDDTGPEMEPKVETVIYIVAIIVEV